MQKAPKRHQLSIKAPRKDHLSLEDFRAIAQHFPSDYEALKYLISVTKSPQFTEHQDCVFYGGEYPDDSKFVICLKEAQKKKGLKFKKFEKREYCYLACPSSYFVKKELNLEAKKIKLEGQVSAFEKKKQGIIDEIKELELTLDEKKKEDHDLTEGIKNLRKLEKAENWLEQKKELEEKHKNEIDKLKQEYEEKLRQKDKEILTLQSLPAEYSEPEPETIEETMVHRKTTFSRKAIQTGKAEAEEPNQNLGAEIYQDYLKNARKEQFKNKEILCPLTTKYVSIIDFCFSKCQHILDCEYYLSLIDGKISEGAQIREKATTNHEEKEQKA